MKRIAVLLLALLLFMACQPTPREDAVRQKDSNELIRIAKETADAAAEGNAAAPALTMAQRFSPRFVCGFTTTTRSVRVSGDVEIKYLADTGFPVLRAERSHPRSEDYAAIAKALLACDTLYEYRHQPSREDIKQQVEQLMYSLDDPEQIAEEIAEFGEDEYYNVREPRKKERLKTLQEQYNSIGEGERVPLIVWDPGLLSDKAEAQQLILVANEWHSGCTDEFPIVRIVYGGSDNPYDQFMFVDKGTFSSWAWNSGRLERIEPCDYAKPQGGFATSPNDAVAKVMELFDGILEIELSEAFLGDDSSTDGDNAGIVYNTGYVLRFTPAYDGAAAVYTETVSTGQSNAEGMAPIWQREAIVVAVNDEGIKALSWTDHVKVTEKVTDNCALLPFDEIRSVFEAQLNRKYADEWCQNAKIELGGVTLGLMCISEQFNMFSGLLVPVWYFTGTVTYSEEYFSEGHTEVLDRYKPLMIINAVDGTIIDSDKGY